MNFNSAALAAILGGLAALPLSAGQTIRGVPIGTLYIRDSKLDWGRADTNLHMGAAFGASLAATEMLEWRGMKTWQATALGSLATAVASVVKEYAVDDFASGNDLMADGIGIAANAALQFTIRF